MEKIKTDETGKGMFRWDTETKKLFFKKNKDEEEKQLICDKCNGELFTVEGAIKRCVGCNKLVI